MEKMIQRTGRTQTFFSRRGHNITFYECTDGNWRDWQGKLLRKHFSNGDQL